MLFGTEKSALDWAHRATCAMAIGIRPSWLNRGRLDAYGKVTGMVAGVGVSEGC